MSTLTDPTTTSEAAGLDPAAICTLPEDGLSDRMAWVRREIVPHSLETLRLEDGLAFELADAPALAEKLDQLIELERECCSAIRFERAESSIPGRLRLEVRGIDPDARVFQSFQPAEASPASGRRAVKAAGVGIAFSLFVCCVVPIAGAALLGAVAAPLASLDGPLPIAIGAIAGGSAAWWWMGRGRRLTNKAAGASATEAACGPDC